MMDDLISRQAAITLPVIPKEYREYQTSNLDDAYEQGWNDLQKCIESLPSAQQWIPCSERLPKELVPVNVTWVNKDPEPYYLMIKDKPFTDTAVYYEGKWYWQSATCVDLLKEYGESPADDVAYGIEIVAWMPLPEPYKEEQT